MCYKMYSQNVRHTTYTVLQLLNMYLLIIDKSFESIHGNNMGLG